MENLVCFVNISQKCCFGKSIVRQSEGRLQNKSAKALTLSSLKPTDESANIENMGKANTEF